MDSPTSAVVAAAPEGFQSKMLSREVLRWIQSLDLAYSVKNVKRDFSNGFLVAEMYSRYYDKEVQMHSFDNGTALRIKKDNWGQILKFFRKAGLDNVVTQEEVNSIIHCEDGAVISLLNRVYEALTRRSVQTVARRPLPEKPPPFARETGAAAMRNEMRAAALQETADETSRAGIMQQRASKHERDLLEERSAEPERFVPTSRVLNNNNGGGGSFKSHSSSVRGGGNNGPRSVGSQIPPMPQVRVKEIQVRQVDRSFAQLRDVGGDNYVEPTTQKNSASGFMMMMPPPVSSSSSEKPDEEEWQKEDLTKARDASELLGEFKSFLDSFPSDADEDEAVLGRLKDQAAELALSCVAKPEGATTILNFFAKLVVAAGKTTLTEDSLLSSAAQCCGAFGREWARRDAAAALTGFETALLPAWLPALAADDDEPRRRTVCALAYDFAAPNAEGHLALIRCLQKQGVNLTRCLTWLAQADFQPSEVKQQQQSSVLAGHYTGTSKAASQLANLHLYYVASALAQSPQIRAAGIAALASATTRLQQHRLEPMACLAPFLPQLTKLAREDEWWETQVALICLSAGVFTNTREELPPELRCALVEILTSLFSPESSLQSKLAGVLAIAPCLSRLEELHSTYVQVLLSLPADDGRDAALFARDTATDLHHTGLVPSLQVRSVTEALDTHFLSDLISRTAKPSPEADDLLNALLISTNHAPPSNSPPGTGGGPSPEDDGE